MIAVSQKSCYEEKMPKMRLVIEYHWEYQPVNGSSTAVWKLRMKILIYNHDKGVTFLVRKSHFSGEHFHWSGNSHFSELKNKNAHFSSHFSGLKKRVLISIPMQKIIPYCDSYLSEWIIMVMLYISCHVFETTFLLSFLKK